MVHPTKSSLANMRIIYEMTKGENVACPTTGKKLSQGLSFSMLQDSWERGSRKEKLRGNWGETGFFARSLFPGSPTFSLVLMHRPRAW